MSRLLAAILLLGTACASGDESPPSSSDPGTTPSNLNGQVPPPPAGTRYNVTMDVAPSVLDFGKVPVGGSADLTINFQNKGPDLVGSTSLWLATLKAPAAFLPESPDNEFPSPFSEVSNNCISGNDRILGVGEACTMVVRYSPIKAKKSRSSVDFKAVGPTNTFFIPVWGDSSP
jgi:hypothetical protein